MVENGKKDKKDEKPQRIGAHLDLEFVHDPGRNGGNQPWRKWILALITLVAVCYALAGLVRLIISLVSHLYELPS